MCVICVILVFWMIKGYFSTLIITGKIEFESGEIKYDLFKLLEIFR